MTSSLQPDSDTRWLVHDVLMRYATAVDTRDWDMIRTCSTDDCQCEYDQIGSWSDLATFADFMAQVHVHVGASVHRISNLVMYLDGKILHCKSYVNALVLAPDGTGGTHMTGSYVDELVKGADGWRISARRCVTTQLTTTAA